MSSLLVKRPPDAISAYFFICCAVAVFEISPALFLDKFKIFLSFS